MPLFAADPRPGAQPVADLLEELGAAVHAQYAALEARLLADIQRAVERNLDEAAYVARAVAVIELGRKTEAALARIDPQTIAADVIRTAAEAGEGAAAARLGLAPRISDEVAASTVFGRTQGRLVNSLVTQLAGGLTAMSPVILRSVQDTYQRVVGTVVSEAVAGGLTPQMRSRRATDLLVQNGLTGFTDKAGRQWTIGSYADMATRTAGNRAWQEANIARMSESGVNLVTIVVGGGACRWCAAWSGKVVSTDGTTGDVVVQHATENRTLTIHIDGTIDQARAAHWNHPNCRCTVVGYMPGLKVPGSATTYDPAAEKARAQLRALERQKRALLRKAELAPDDVARAEAKRAVRALDGRIRDHVSSSGLIRQRHRESLLFERGTNR